MNKQHKERLHLFRHVEEVLREMNLNDVKECSEATLQSMKRIFKELRIFLYHVEVMRIERARDEGRISPKEAVHRKALLRKKYF